MPSGEHELEFYRDADSNPCVRGDDERLARFLETDLQGSVEVTQALLTRLDATEARGEFSGNAHTVTITEETVTIDCEFDDGPDRRLSRDEFREVVAAWLRFIR